VDPHCFDAEPDPDPAQNLDADLDPDPDPGGGGRGGRSAKNVHLPWQNPRYAPDFTPFVLFVGSGEVASDERSPLRGGGTQGQDFQTRGEIIFLYISDLFRTYSGPIPVLNHGPNPWSKSPRTQILVWVYRHLKS
jgi:hypothetical protein